MGDTIMRRSIRMAGIFVGLLALSSGGCDDDSSNGGDGGSNHGSDGGSQGDGGSSDGGASTDGAVIDGSFPDTLPAAGNPTGGCAIPSGGGLENVSSPKTVVGTGTPGSCTSAAVVAAVAKGGVITFDCGPDPVTITLTETARIYNDSVTSANPKIVIDGGGKVTLSGGGVRRILYLNTCDPANHLTTPQCQNQDHPQLTVQNLTFVDGHVAGSDGTAGSGGAIYAQGGRLKIVNSRFFRNTCNPVGPDLGGAAVRTWMQYNDLPVFVVNSTFGGASGLGNVGSNGGGLSGLDVSFTVVNSLFTHNQAIGDGANPPQPNTPGGGSGGAIYNDGNTFTLSICGTRMTNNSANEGGGAIFFVSNDGSGTLSFRDSFLSMNPSAGFETSGYPGIYVNTSQPVQKVNTTIE